MRYAFLIYLDEPASQARPPADIAAAMAAHTPYIEMLQRNRRYIASAALTASAQARTLRGTSGKPIVTDGPFAESREQFGGFYLVEADDLDAATALARECPALATKLDHVVGLEIRPVVGGELGDGAAALVRYRDEAAAPAGDAADLRLAPSSSATTLRRRDGAIVLVDGPFAAGRHQMAGLRLAPAGDPTPAPDEAIEVRGLRV